MVTIVNRKLGARHFYYQRLEERARKRAALVQQQIKKREQEIKTAEQAIKKREKEIQQKIKPRALSLIQLRTQARQEKIARQLYVKRVTGVKRAELLKLKPFKEQIFKAKKDIALAKTSVSSFYKALRRRKVAKAETKFKTVGYLKGRFKIPKKSVW